MTRKRNLKTSFLLMLRRFGMLCKAPAQPKKGLRLSKSLMPDGQYIVHDTIVTELPEHKQDLEAQIHVYHELKKLSGK